jgi:hypothetical protein
VLPGLGCSLILVLEGCRAILITFVVMHSKRDPLIPWIDFPGRFSLAIRNPALDSQSALETLQHKSLLVSGIVRPCT